MYEPIVLRINVIYAVDAGLTGHTLSLGSSNGLHTAVFSKDSLRDIFVYAVIAFDFAVTH